MSSGRASVWVLAVLAWIGVIFFSSTSLASKWAENTFYFISDELLRNLPHSSSSFGLIHLLADKGFHVTLFFILAILLWLALVNIAHKEWLILATGAIVGSFSEYLQSFFPDRDPAFRDVLINIGGTALGLLICVTISKLVSRRSQEPAPV